MRLHGAAWRRMALHATRMQRGKHARAPPPYTHLRSDVIQRRRAQPVHVLQGVGGDVAQRALHKHSPIRPMHIHEAAPVILLFPPLKVLRALFEIDDMSFQVGPG